MRVKINRTFDKRNVRALVFEHHLNVHGIYDTLVHYLNYSFIYLSMYLFILLIFIYFICLHLHSDTHTPVTPTRSLMDTCTPLRINNYFYSTDPH